MIDPYQFGLNSIWFNGGHNIERDTMLDSFTMPAETTSERLNGSVITRYGNGRYGGEFRRTRGNDSIPYCQYVDRPDFTFDPCEYCEVDPADGRCSNGARVCLPCYEDHHGPIY